MRAVRKASRPSLFYGVFHRLSVQSLIIAAAIFACSGESGIGAVDPADSPAATLLREYIRIDTSNPPGNETRGAAWLAGRLQDAGIEAQLLGDDPDRKSVYARIEGAGDAPALVLLHHIDVVPADADSWSVDPFAAEVRGGYVWGRGAIDAKSLGIAHLLAFVDLAQQEASLSRDVIFLGVADEEAGGLSGMEPLLETHPALFSDVGFVLNEGGGNQVVVDETIFWGIEIDQKVALWIELIAKGSGGHGAGIHDDSAVMHLLRVLDRVRRVEPERSVTPAVRSYFESLARVKKGRKADILADIDRYVLSPELESNLPKTYLGLLQDTWTISALDAGDRVNVVPDQALARIDIRLVPGTDPSAVLGQLSRMAESDAEVKILLRGEPSQASPIGTDLWKSVARVLEKNSPDAVVGPMVALGTTDSRFFRERGIVAYGFSPFKINYYDGATVHGQDERIRLTFFLEGVELMKEIVDDFCVHSSVKN